MTTLPGVTVSIAFTTAPEDPDPEWQDVTQYVKATVPISITRGRQDEFGEVQPSRCGLTLLNIDGRFTPERVGSPYYPNVKKSRRIRVSATWGGVTYHRFTGYIDEWPVAWSDASASNAEVALTATSRFARLAKGRELRSIIESEYLLDDPAAYYPFGDPAGTIRAGDVSTSVQVPLTAARAGGTGGGIFFGQATGPETDDLTAATFSPVNPSNGFYMQGLFNQPIVTAADTTIALECFFSTSTLADQDLLRLDLASGRGEASVLAVLATGRLRAVAAPNLGATTYLLETAGSVVDGATHHALIRETISGGNLTATLFLDGVQVGTSTTPYTAFGSRNRLAAGGNGFGCFKGVLAHVAVTAGATELTAARVAAHADAGLTGGSGESSDERIVRLARYAGVPASEVSVEAGQSRSLVNQLTTGITPIALMQDVVKTEAGILFDAGDGSLSFHARSHRYNSASVLTLSGGGAELDGELDGDLQPKLDDLGLANDIAASRPLGVAMRAVDTASIEDYGLYRESLELLTTDDDEVADAAYWNLNLRAEPLVRVPVCGVNLHNASSAQKTAILAVELGDKITLAGLPSQAPASSLDCFVEGVSEQITQEVHRVGYNLSPASLAGVWQLDSSTYSVLGTTTRLAY